jgi:hypothetical protein
MRARGNDDADSTMGPHALLTIVLWCAHNKALAPRLGAAPISLGLPDENPKLHANAADVNSYRSIDG